jgi:predicted solute-binding protein
MNPPDDVPKLRLAPPDSPEELAHRFEREQRAAQLQRESRLENSLAPFRVGSVPHLNAVPLTRGLEDQLVFASPAALAQMLAKDELDAALVSVTEVLFSDRYDVLDGIAISSLGEVKSVFLAHRGRLTDVQEVFCDAASLSSVSLLRVLLAERGLFPEFKPLADYDNLASLEAFLLIGDRALDFLLAPHEHEVWDLGAAWYDQTRLPFVYAVWALRRGIANEPLRRLLREARDFGLETLDYIVSSRTEYTLDFRRDYLTWHIHYHLGSDERRGLAKFIELLRKHCPDPVHDLRFVA